MYWRGRGTDSNRFSRVRRYLKSIDKFHEWTVSVWLTPGGAFGGQFQNEAELTILCAGVKLILLHELKNDDGIRLFLQETWENYVKVRLSRSHRVMIEISTDMVRMLSYPQTLMNPFHELNAPIRSSVFDARVRASARKHL